jgi:hypothetical protein
MKLIGVLNGWVEAPHCWRRYLLRPVEFDAAPRWISISVLGVAWFFERR